MSVEDEPSDCLFCQITSGAAPSEELHRAEGVVAFRDKFPRAPVHVLVAPERHLGSAHDLTDADADLVMTCLRVARAIAEQEGVADGYRLATNVGTKGGQMVPHLHFHVLGGRQLGHIDSGEPPAS
jgi:histidine triad (HIT) family protein